MIVVFLFFNLISIVIFFTAIFFIVRTLKSKSGNLKKIYTDSYKYESDNKGFIMNLLNLEYSINKDLSNLKKKRKELLNDNYINTFQLKSQLESINQELRILKSEHEAILKKLKTEQVLEADKSLEKVIEAGEKLSAHMEDILNKNNEILQK